MNRFSWAGLLLVTCLGIYVSCNKSDNSSKDCTASPASAKAPSDGLASYYVNSTDPLAKTSSIIYQGANGPVTLPGAILPWNTAVFVKAGSRISISVVGVSSGKITAGYSFNNGTDSVSNYASCSK